MTHADQGPSARSEANRRAVRTLRRSVAATALALVAGGLASTPACAQQRRLAPDDSLMPISLFRAFAEMMFPSQDGMPETKVLVGSIPAGVELRLPPLPGARPLGMISTPIVDVVLLDVDAPADSVRARILRELPSRGWRPAPQPSLSGGFVKTSSGPQFWCGQSSVLRYAVRDQEGSSARVSYSFLQADASACSMRSSSATSNLPTLYHPEEGDATPAQCMRLSTGRSAHGTSGWLATQLTPEQLLDHYGKQLADSGWRPTTSAGPGAVVERHWRRAGTASDGEDRTLTITVHVPAGKPECRILEMNLETRTGR